jgi:hypothetical protein
LESCNLGSHYFDKNHFTFGSSALPPTWHNDVPNVIVDSSIKDDLGFLNKVVIAPNRYF